jgi:hypothetical protein
MRWRSASLVERLLLPSRLRALETVILDTPTRAAMSAMVTWVAGGAGTAAAAGDGLVVAGGGGFEAVGLRAGKALLR